MGWQHSGCGAVTPGAWLKKNRHIGHQTKNPFDYIVRPNGIGPNWNPFQTSDSLLDRSGKSICSIENCPRLDVC
jgi:hypothetical protein